MEWFSGSIGEAIATAKNRSSLFVVVIHGPEDEASTQELIKNLNSNEVSSLLKKAVCIKLQNGTDLCGQFAQIYPVILIPSIYFIDSRTGVDLEITGGAELSQQKILDSIEKAVNKFQAKADGQEASSSASVAAHPVTQEPSTSENIDKQASLNDRVAKAKELLAARKAQKADQEAEDERRKEIERREMGKAVTKMKQQQEDDELKRAAEERRKDKEETRIAREKIKAQIEQDRKERNEKFNREKEEREAAAKEKEREKLAEEAAKKESEIRNRSSIARIQFRLPDGRSQTKQFAPDDPLSALYAFARSELNLSFSSFSLSTTFPNRQLDLESQTESLRQLGLVPSATVLVLPKSGGDGGIVQVTSGGLMSLIWLLLTPFSWIWGILNGFFNPASSGSSQQGREGSTGGGNKRPGANSTSAYRRHGNIARLRQGEDDDESNTYNGNSTQQM